MWVLRSRCRSTVTSLSATVRVNCGRECQTSRFAAFAASHAIWPVFCAVVSDYVPKGLQLPARVGVLGLSVVTAAGLMKLALAGPGIGGTIKQLWSRPEKTSA